MVSKPFLEISNLLKANVSKKKDKRTLELCLLPFATPPLDPPHSPLIKGEDKEKLLFLGSGEVPF